MVLSYQVYFPCWISKKWLIPTVFKSAVSPETTVLTAYRPSFVGKVIISWYNQCWRNEWFLVKVAVNTVSDTCSRQCTCCSNGRIAPGWFKHIITVFASPDDIASNVNVSLKDLGDKTSMDGAFSFRVHRSSSLFFAILYISLYAESWNSYFTDNNLSPDKGKQQWKLYIL